VDGLVTVAPAAIGIFGGTFDPVHYGHLRAALEAREKLGLEDMRLLPAGTPPHRSGTVASATHRLAMLKLALSGDCGLRVDDREVRREGSSFMVDTLAELRREYPGSPLLLMIGQDAANALDQWHDWRALFGLAHLVIMRRPESVSVYSIDLDKQIQCRLTGQVADLKASIAGRVLPLELTQLAISSTDIRRRINQDKSPQFLLPDAVISYIRQQRLYTGE
jgi:nicotinate-nucleotide adenylyltransferase